MSTATARLGLCTVLIYCTAGLAHAQLYIDFGTGDSIAVAQPFLEYQLRDPATGDPVGPTPAIDFTTFSPNYLALVDTAAQGILLSQPAYLEPVDFLSSVINPNKYTRAIDPGTGLPTVYTEQGVSGTADLDVLVPYDLRLTDTYGTTFDASGPFTAIAHPDLQLSFFGAIVGTAALEGHAAIFENTTLNHGTIVLQGTPFPDVPHVGVSFNNVPAITPTTYDIDLTPLVIPPHNTDPTPSFGNLYGVANTGLGPQSANVAGTMIVDTGAQLTIISSAIADALGLDYTSPEVPTLEIGGLGEGSIDAPIVILSELRLPTDQGVDLIIRNLEVAVLDIPGLEIAGIMGNNVLTSGYFLPVLIDLLTQFGGDINDWFFDEEGDFGGVDISDLATSGFFDRAVFDLRNMADPKLRLDVNPLMHNVVPEPGAITLALGAIGFALIHRRRTRS